jgi:hypothetical protein
LLHPYYYFNYDFESFFLKLFSNHAAREEHYLLQVKPGSAMIHLRYFAVFWEVLDLSNVFPSSFLQVTASCKTSTLSIYWLYLLNFAHWNRTQKAPREWRSSENMIAHHWHLDCRMSETLAALFPIREISLMEKWITSI